MDMLKEDIDHCFAKTSNRELISIRKETALFFAKWFSDDKLYISVWNNLGSVAYPRFWLDEEERVGVRGDMALCEVMEMG